MPKPKNSAILIGDIVTTQVFIETPACYCSEDMHNMDNRLGVVEEIEGELIKVHGYYWPETAVKKICFKQLLTEHIKKHDNQTLLDVYNLGVKSNSEIIVTLENRLRTVTLQLEEFLNSSRKYTNNMLTAIAKTEIVHDKIKKAFINDLHD
jgi:hypothetical protein